MSLNVLRPGSRLGIYPQRLEAPASEFERIGSAWLARAVQSVSWRKYRLSHVLQQVELMASGLAQLDDIALEQRRDEIRYALMRDGLKSHAVWRCFALVREIAVRSLNMRHYDVQVFGAWVIVNGNLAEMATGEGKTLTATLAAATAALAGIPVHIITTNEYLAQRDASDMRPLYEALGLSVTTVVEAMDTDEKRSAYRSDIVYLTNKQIAFDYLRDRLISRKQSGPLSLKFGQTDRNRQLVLRGLCFAIVDEADSVLIDEARTPLILSKEHQDDNLQGIYEQALELAASLQLSQDFNVFDREHKIELTAAGRAELHEQAGTLDGIWAGARHREFLVQQALCALHLYRRDEHYLLRDGKIEIIDKNTGRTMADRSWQRGLHQMIECKEGCEMSGQRETLASISYQRFFQRYLHLGGMSGTLRQVAGEMGSVYRKQVIAVPTHRPCQRQDQGVAFFRRGQDKWLAVLAHVERVHLTGQPVLIGTSSLHNSELLSAFLTRRKLSHRILNARQDKDEAQIIALAGQAGQITIATNMAGRGTDIKLGPGVEQLGGLHAVSTERHEEARVDHQLYGRCARQGDPGSIKTMLSLNDSLIQGYYPDKVRRILGRYMSDGRSVPQWVSSALIWLPQYRISRSHKLDRQDVMQMDEKLGKILAYSGKQE